MRVYLHCNFECFRKGSFPLNFNLYFEPVEEALFEGVVFADEDVDVCVVFVLVEGSF